MKRTNYKGYVIDKDTLDRTYIYNTNSPYSESDDRNYHTGKGTLKDAKAAIEKEIAERDAVNA